MSKHKDDSISHTVNTKRFLIDITMNKKTKVKDPPLTDEELALPMYKEVMPWLLNKPIFKHSKKMIL